MPELAGIGKEFLEKDVLLRQKEFLIGKQKLSDMPFESDTYGMNYPYSCVCSQDATDGCRAMQRQRKFPNWQHFLCGS